MAIKVVSSYAITISVWFVLLFQTVIAQAVVLSDTTFYRKYPYIIIVEDDEPLPSLTDELFFDRAAQVTFPVGVSRLPDGAPLLRELQATVIPQLNGDSLQLVRMLMRGAASPEGSVALNRRLGGERVKALCTFFADNMRFPLADEILSMDNDIEDYRSLCLLMERANDPDYELVKTLCDKYLPSDLAELKRVLQTTGGGRLWQRLLATYFPQLRTARFIIVMRKYNPPAPVIDIAPVEPVKAVETVTPVTPEAPAIVADTLTVIAPDTAVLCPPVLPEEILPRRELLSVKTNMLFYAAYIPGYDRWCPIPNIAVEYYPKGGHFTLGASFDMPWWQDYDAHKYFQIRNYQVETRYYLKGNTDLSPLTPHPSPLFSGFYLQAYAHLGLFGICFDADRGWVGEGGGGGLGLGYVTPISKNGHWRLEFGLQAGYFRCKYDPYKYENPVNPAFRDNLYYYKWTDKPELFKKRQYRWSWIGPTRIGVTLTYDLLYRRIQKRGASFKSTEKVKMKDRKAFH